MSEATKRSQRWRAAVQTLPDVVPWKVVRWVFAQQYNAHHPHPCQEPMHRMSRDVAADLVQRLGGDLMAPPSRADVHGAPWARFLAAMRDLDNGQRRMILRKVVDVWCEQYPNTYEGRADARRMQEVTRRLHLLLDTMQHQQEINAAGWVPGEGFTKRSRAR